MEKPTFDPEESIVSIQDVKRLYMSMWRKLLKWAILGGVASFLFFGSMSVKYKAQASFKEGIEQSSSENLIRDLMGGMGGSPPPQAASIMKSNQVLRPLTEKMGMQMSFARSDWMPLKLFRRYREAWRAEKGLLLADVDPFVFEDVHYGGENTIPLHIVFSKGGLFTVYDWKKKKELGKGAIGESVQLQDPQLQFTIKSVPKWVKKGSYYPFHIEHWVSPAGSLRGLIKIKADKDNKTVINISIANRDRHLAARIVNEVMFQYQAYLKREYDHTAREQLDYLEGRQGQLLGQMEQLFDQHALYLSQNVKENGFIGLEQETESHLFPHQQMRNKVLSIDVELSRLDQIEQDGEAIGVAEESSFSQGINYISHQIHDLKQQRDLIELSFCQATQPTLQAHRDELKEVRNQRFELEKLIQEVEIGAEISACDFNQALSLWAKDLTDPEEREDMAEYLENYARILSMREKTLQERFFYGNSAPPPELEGIDIASARSLFLEYNKRLDAAEAAMHHYAQFKKEIPNPHFDIASLSSVLKDPLCQKIIGEASELGVRLKDEQHYSAKEGERWKQEIALNRKILTDHLEQLYQVEELNAGLIRQKMGGLQKIVLDCLNRQISVLHEQMSDGVKEKRQALLREKELLEEKMGEIRSSLAATLPEKWRFEKWLNIKTTMVSKVMQTMTEVVESKTMANHLHHVQSKPLDVAISPTAPQPPYLYAMTCLGAFVLPFFIFSLAFIRQFLKGFPSSMEKLKALRLPVLGPISAFCDGPSVETASGPDLDLLRNIALFSEGGKVIGLIGGNGPDYSYALGENLSRRHTKAIMVRCDFDSPFRKEDAPGILQMWKGEIGEPPIRKGKGFDYILAGGYTPFGTEIIQSRSFGHLLDQLRTKYDWVYLFFRTPLSSAESLAALRLCDKAIVTVSGEQTEELTPFVHWGYDEDRCRLTFITRT